MVEPVCSSQMLMNFYQTSWYHIPEYSNLHGHCRESLKSHKSTQFCFFISYCQSLLLSKSLAKFSSSSSLSLELSSLLPLSLIFFLQRCVSRWKASHLPVVVYLCYLLPQFVLSLYFFLESKSERG
jgi:hypothetical protein